MLTLVLIATILTSYFIILFNQLEGEPAPVKTAERNRQR